MAMSGDDKPGKLPANVLLPSGSNYVAWATRVQNKLEKEDVWDVVQAVADGGRDVPAAGANAATRKSWRIDNATAKEIILKVLDDTMTALAGNRPLARDIWNSLAADHLLSGENDRTAARTELAKLRLKYTAPIKDLLVDLERLFGIFTYGADPAPLTNGEKIAYTIAILRAAGGRWQKIADTEEAVARRAPANAPGTWLSFKAMLQREQRDREQRVGGWANDFNPGANFKNKFHGAGGKAYQAALDNGCSEEQAMAVAAEVGDGGGGGGGGGNPRRRRGGGPTSAADKKCFNCGQNGHWKNECNRAAGCHDCHTNEHNYGGCPHRDHKRPRPSGPSAASAASTRRGSAANTGGEHQGVDINEFARARGLSAEQISFMSDLLQAAKEKGGMFCTFELPHAPAQALRASWTEKRGWLIDSGATNHMTPHASDFTRRGEPHHVQHGGVRVADDKVIPTRGVGTATIFESSAEGKILGTVNLPNTLHVPDLAERLASVNAWSAEGKRVTFEPNHGPVFVTIPRNKEERDALPPGEVVIEGRHDGHLWRVTNAQPRAHSAKSVAASLVSDSALAFVVNLDLFHQRFGHIGVARLKEALKQRLAREHEPGFTLDAKRREVMQATLGFCEVCQLANSRKKPARRSGSKPDGASSRAVEDNYRFYLDACIVNVVARTGAVCFVVLVDCKSRWGAYGGLRARKDVFEFFLSFQSLAERQMEKPIKIVRCDNAQEYVHGRLGAHFSKEGIELELTSKGTSSMNAPAERRIQSITNMIRAMLSGSSLDATYWDDAGEEANAIINDAPTSSLPNMMSPYVARFGKPSNLAQPRVWGCPAYVHLLPVDRDSKVEQRSVKTIYLGREGRLYKCLDTVTGVVIKSAHVNFDESMQSGYGQGRVNRGLPGATSLQFRNAEGVDLDTGERGPLPTTIVGDREIGNNYIPESFVVPLSRPAPTGAELTAPPRDRLTRIDSDDFEYRGDFEVDDNIDGQRPIYGTSGAPTTASENDGERAPEPAPMQPAPEALRRSQREHVPVQRDESFVWGASPLLQPGLQVHPNPDAGLNGGASANVAAQYGGYFASQDDVASTLRGLNRRGLDLETVAMAYVTVAAKTNADSDVRPVVMAMAAITGREPRNMIEISKFGEPEQTRWRQATQDEYDALIKNETWELVPRPPGRKVTRCKWVFKLKRGGDGEVTRYKARLVAQGFTQQYGVDYHETWAPTMSPVSMRSILAIGNAKGWERLKQGDVPNAYLKAKLMHEVLMEQPEGFAVKGKEDWVCRLLKALYGLKQAGREWNAQITDKLVNQWGYVQSRVDGCVFTRRDEKGLVGIVGLYVDDCLGYLRDEAEEKRLGAHMLSSYGVVLEDVDYFCGLKIERDLERRRLFISQEAYIDRVIKEFDDETWQGKPPRTPADASARLTKDQAPKNEAERATMSKKPYSRLVGALLWVAMMTRPDICDQVQKLSQFLRDPGEAHWSGAMRVVRYLKGTKRHGIMFDGAGIVFRANNDGTETIEQPITFYCDADYAGDTDDRKSTSGLLASIAGAFVMWRAKKQGGVTLCTMEAELVSMGTAVQESEGLVAGLLEMGIRTTLPSIINEDNQSAILYVKDGRNQSKARHIGVRFHYVRESVRDGKVRIEYCPTTKMLADIMTKAIPADQFEYLRNGIGVVAVPREVGKLLGDGGTKALMAISGEWECRDYSAA